MWPSGTHTASSGALLAVILQLFLLFSSLQEFFLCGNHSEVSFHVLGVSGNHGLPCLVLQQMWKCMNVPDR